MIPHKQLSMAEIFSDCQEKFENDKYRFLSLLEDTINLNKYNVNDIVNIPVPVLIAAEWFTSIPKMISVLIQEPFEVLMNAKKPAKYGLL